MRPIDEARTVLVEVLIRAVETRNYGATVRRFRGDAVVSAAADAAPKLDVALAKLHTALDPWQRAKLADGVQARLAGWSAEWKGGAPEDHVWLASIRTEQLARSAEGTRATSRRWADGLVSGLRHRCCLRPSDRSMVRHGAC